MKVIYSDQELPTQFNRSVFLAGPTPRDTETVSWRKICNQWWPSRTQEASWEREDTKPISLMLKNVGVISLQRKSEGISDEK